MISIRNTAAVKKQVEAWINKAEDEAAKVATGLAVTAFNTLLYASPQKSADFVSNWRYSQGKVDTTFEERGWIDLKDPDTWFLKGSTKGIMVAKAEQAGREKGFKLGGKIFLSNSAQHNGHPYAQKIESGEVKFRPGNTGAPVEYATHAVSMYNIINKNQALRLMKKTIGGS